MITGVREELLREHSAFPTPQSSGELAPLSKEIIIRQRSVLYQKLHRLNALNYKQISLRLLLEGSGNYVENLFYEVIVMILSTYWLPGNVFTTYTYLLCG